MCACLILLSSACTPRVVVRPEIVEVPVIQYRPLPDRLTQPLELPRLPDRFTNGDLLQALIDAEALIQRANADRLEAKRLTDEP